MSTHKLDGTGQIQGQDVLAIRITLQGFDRFGATHLHPAHTTAERFQLLDQDQSVHARRRCLSNRSRTGRKSAASVHARDNSAALAELPRPTSLLPRKAEISNTGPASRRSTRSTGRPVISANASTRARRSSGSSGLFANTPTSKSLSGLAVPSATDPNTDAKAILGSAASRDAILSNPNDVCGRSGMPGLWHAPNPLASTRQTTATDGVFPQRLPATAVTVLRGAGGRGQLLPGTVDAQGAALVVCLHTLRRGPRNVALSR